MGILSLPISLQLRMFVKEKSEAQDLEYHLTV